MVLRVVEDLSTQVRAGVDPDRAWTTAWQLAVMDGRSGLPDLDGGAPEPVIGSGTSTARILLPGERPVDAARRLARSPGASAPLVALAAAWRLSDDVGAPLADVLATVADGVRQDAEIAAEIEAELAGPRATARLLAVLPLAGLALGQLLGARPLAVLLTTTPGRWCAIGGLGLAACGQVWTRWLVTRTERLL